MSEDFRIKVQSAFDAGVIIGDGHTLFAPEYYAPHFTADELAKADLIQKHESDGTHKGSIMSPDGSFIQELEAVYNLDFLYWVSEELGVTENTSEIGRGSQAQQLVGFISKALAA